MLFSPWLFGDVYPNCTIVLTAEWLEQLGAAQQGFIYFMVAFGASYPVPGLGGVLGPFNKCLDAVCTPCAGVREIPAGSQCSPCPYCSLPLLGGLWNFAFTVKFYPPDPAQLTEDITR